MDEAREAATPHLLVRTGAAAGVSFPARDGLTIGRHPLNDLCLRDAGVASHHAQLHRSPQGWQLDDLSGEGLHIDGHPRPRALLTPGAMIRLGPVELEWTRGAPSARAPSALHTRTITQVLPSPAEPGAGFREATGLGAEALETVLSFEASIAEEQDFDHLLDVLADWVHAAVPAHHSAVLLRDGRGHLRTYRKRSHDGEDLEPSRSIVEQAVGQHVGVLILDAPEDERVRHGKSIMLQNIRSALCVPLVARSQVIGALYAATSGISAAFTKGHLELLTLVAGPTASAVQSALLVRELSDTNRDLLRRLAICARFNDDDTGYHIQRVGDYAAALAEALGQPDGYCALLRAAAPMHDIGKIGIPQSILQKPGKLTREEFDAMKQHTLIGEQILSGSRAPLIQLAAELAGTHHEKFDGSGYPRGLAGDKIPLSGRIVAVADVFDALVTQRCYKPAFELDKAYAILREGAGQHFDPRVVAKFFQILEQILAIRARYAALEQAHAQTPIPKVAVA